MTIAKGKICEEHLGTTGLYFGTSSWTAVGWETAFYPPCTKEVDYLPFYAGRFISVEIDSTFYRIAPRPAIDPLW
jgi:uncharacterized protein YecE (DUF72 family)